MSLASLKTTTPWIFLALVALSMAGCGNDDADLCAPTNSAGLSRALAQPGECSVVSLRGPRYSGSFEVQAGTLIEGRGAEITGFGEAVFRVEGGTETRPTRLVDLRIVNDGAAVMGFGGGHIALESLDIRVESVVGILAEGLDGMTIEDVQVAGTITQETLPFLGESINFQQFPIAGVLVARSGFVSMSNVELSGFAGFGAAFFDTDGQWTGGVVRGCVGSSVFVENGDLTLEGLTLEDGMRGRLLGFHLLSVGVLNTAGGHLITEDLQIQGFDGLGMFQDNATSAHSGLQILDNRDEGIWVQNSPGSEGRPSLLLQGGNNILRGNRGAGVLVRDSAGVVMDGVEIADTGLKITITNQAARDIGDGLQLSGLSGGVSLRGLSLSDNQRVGLLLDGTGADALGEATFEIDGVVVEGAETPDAFGALVQNFDTPPDLSAVDVEAALAERDADAPVLSIPIPIETITSMSSLADAGFIGDRGLLTSDGGVAQVGIVTETGLVIERNEGE